MTTVGDLKLDPIPMKCPQCLKTFNILDPAEMVFGTDAEGLYLEHLPCGFRGRPRYTPKFSISPPARHVCGCGLPFCGDND